MYWILCKCDYTLINFIGVFIRCMNTFIPTCQAYVYNAHRMSEKDLINQTRSWRMAKLCSTSMELHMGNLKTLILSHHFIQITQYSKVVHESYRYVEVECKFIIYRLILIRKCFFKQIINKNLYKKPISVGNIHLPKYPKAERSSKFILRIHWIFKIILDTFFLYGFEQRYTSFRLHSTAIVITMIE